MSGGGRPIKIVDGGEVVEELFFLAAKRHKGRKTQNSFVFIFAFCASLRLKN